jgi:hypothetical protein
MIGVQNNTDTVQALRKVAGGQWNVDSVAPTLTTRINYDGHLYATSFFGVGTNLTSLNAGNIGSGTLIVARGGTNATSVSQGGIIYGASASAYASTSAGTTNQILKSNGSSAPTWANGLVEEFPSGTTTRVLTSGKTYLIVSSPASASASRTFTLMTYDANDNSNGTTITVNNMCIVNFAASGAFTGTANLRGTQLGNASGTTAPAGINIQSTENLPGARVEAISSVNFIVYRIG